MRLLYFSLASTWGMLVGTAAVAGAMAGIGQPITPHPMLIGGVAIAALLAIAGGAVAANAYRQASSR